MAALHAAARPEAAPYHTAATNAAAKGFPMARPQGHQSLIVSPSLNVSLSQCLRRSRVSGLWSHPPFPTPRARPAAGEAGTGAGT